MALLALDSCPDMPLMCEVNKIRNIMYFDPRNWLLLVPVLLHLLYLGPIGRDGLMAAHTPRDAGHTGRWRSICVHVTVQAGNVVLARVDAMTELYGLNRRPVGIEARVDRVAAKKSQHHDEADLRRPFEWSQCVKYRYGHTAFPF